MKKMQVSPCRTGYPSFLRYPSSLPYFFVFEDRGNASQLKGDKWQVWREWCAAGRPGPKCMLVAYESGFFFPSFLHFEHHRSAVRTNSKMRNGKCEGSCGFYGFWGQIVCMRHFLVGFLFFLPHPYPLPYIFCILRTAKMRIGKFVGNWALWGCRGQIVCVRVSPSFGISFFSTLLLSPPLHKIFCILRTVVALRRPTQRWKMARVSGEVRSMGTEGKLCVCVYVNC